MCNPEEDFEIVPIPLDGDTIERLGRLARASGQNPLECAGALLRDLLLDDALAHGETPVLSGNLN